MLAVHHIKKLFGEKIAVNDVTFAIEPGEIYSLIGPNGSGKTTIIKLVAGLLHLNAGDITVGGYNVARDPLQAKAIIGYIPDEPIAWPGMTGEEFLHFSGALYDIPKDIRTKKITELLSLFHLEGIEKEYFEDYSRGNKQKLTIVAALLHEPKLLLIDEPIVGLDPESAIVAKRIFKDFADRGGAILLVTHTLTVAEEISTKIGILKKGRLAVSGTLEELRTHSSRDTHASLEEIYTHISVHKS